MSIPRNSADYSDLLFVGEEGDAYEFLSRSRSDLVAEVDEFERNSVYSTVQSEADGQPEEVPRRRGFFIGSVTKFLRNFWEGLSTFFSLEHLQRLFDIPYHEPPVCYFPEDAFTNTGEFTDKFKEREFHKGIEVMGFDLEGRLNYPDAKTIVKYEKILTSRRLENAEKRKYKENRYNNIEISQFPQWDLQEVDRIQRMFKMFDPNDDGVVTFDELNETLDAFGNSSTEQTRKVHFDRADKGQTENLTFDEFLHMVFDLRYGQSKGSPEELEDEEKLAQGFHQIESSLEKMRSMNFVTQMQTGLF